MAKLVCQSVVKKLLRVGISYKGDSLAKYLESEVRAPIWDIALAWHPELKGKYGQAMAELEKELVPKHISSQTLYTKLWTIFREVVLNKHEFQRGEKLQNKIHDFSKEVKKPLIAFDVIYEIKNFNIGARHFTLGNVEVFGSKADCLQTLCLNPEALLELHKVLSEWKGSVVAKIEVNASESDGASVLGTTEVNNALNILRLAVRKELFSKASEDMFFWELGENIVIPKGEPQEEVLFSVFDSGGVRPFIIDLGNTIEKLLEDKNVWKYILDGKLPEDISIRILKAIEWICHAITVGSLDYKLVDLCTALEILLLPGHTSGRKGEPIAWRQVLIGRGSSCNPTAVLSLYEKRSDIIHEGYMNITSYYDYYYLLACCVLVLEGVVRLSQKNLHIHNLRELLGIVENKETLGDFIKRCKIGSYEGKGIKKIIEVAEDHLKKIKQ